MSVNTRRNFNLIREAAEAEEEVRFEKGWYLATNVFVICMCIIISAFTFVMDRYTKNKLKEAVAQLTEKNITALESKVRKEAEDTLTQLNDKYTIYRSFIVDNIDFTLFYGEIKKIYPDLQITEFELSPTTNILEVSARLPKGGYGSLSKIIQECNDNEFFDVIKIESIGFSPPPEIDFDDVEEAVSDEEKIEDLTESTLVYQLGNSELFETSFDMTLEFDPSKIIRYNF